MGRQGEPRHISLPFVRTTPPFPHRATGPHVAAAIHIGWLLCLFRAPRCPAPSPGRGQTSLPRTSTDVASRGGSVSAGTRGAAHQLPPLRLHHPAARTLLRDAADTTALTVIKGEILRRAHPTEQDPESRPAPRTPASPSAPEKGCLPALRCRSHTSVHRGISLILPPFL